MQLGHLLRASDQRKVYPEYLTNEPLTVTKGDPKLVFNLAMVILSTEMCFTFVYTTVYLCAKYAYHQA
jgi:hypothetical protein